MMLILQLASKKKKKKRQEQLEGLLIKLLNTSYAVLLVIYSSARNKTS